MVKPLRGEAASRHMLPILMDSVLTELRTDEEMEAKHDEKYREIRKTFMLRHERLIDRMYADQRRDGNPGDDSALLEKLIELLKREVPGLRSHPRALYRTRRASDPDD